MNSVRCQFHHTTLKLVCIKRCKFQAKSRRNHIPPAAVSLIWFLFAASLPNSTVFAYAYTPVLEALKCKAVFQQGIHGLFNPGNHLVCAIVLLQQKILATKGIQTNYSDTHQSPGLYGLEDPGHEHTRHAPNSLHSPIIYSWSLADVVKTLRYLGARYKCAWTFRSAKNKQLYYRHIFMYIMIMQIFCLALEFFGAAQEQTNTVAVELFSFFFTSLALM